MKPGDIVKSAVSGRRFIVVPNTKHDARSYWALRDTNDVRGPFPCAGIDTSIGIQNFSIDRGEDGLSLDWNGFVFCNPPFSQKEIWAKKMASHGNGILLLPERGSAPWFFEILESCKTYFVFGKKINFIGGSSSNNVGSVMFLFGDEAIKRIEDSNLPGHMVIVTKNTRRK